MASGQPLKVRTIAPETESVTTSADHEQQMHDIFRAMIANNDPAFCSICEKDAGLSARPLYKRVGSYNDPRTRILEPKVILRLVCEDCLKIVEQIYSWGVPQTGKIMKVCLDSTLFMEDGAHTTFIEQGKLPEPLQPREGVTVLEFDSGQKYEWEMAGPPRSSEPSTISNAVEENKEMIEWDHGKFVALYVDGPSVAIPNGFDGYQADAYTKAAYQGITIHDERSPLRRKREKEQQQE